MGEASEDPEVVAAKFAVGKLSAKAMARFAEQALIADPDATAWLEVLLIEGDRASDFEPVFEAALRAHGIEVPTPEVAVARIARSHAQEAIQKGLSPLDAATFVVSQYSFGEGPTLPDHIYHLDLLLDIFHGSHPRNRQEYLDDMREEVRRLASGQPSSAR